MIKFTAGIDENRKMIGLGLSHKNLEKLKEGKPIQIDGKVLGFPDIEILLFAGETEEIMEKEIRQNFSISGQGPCGTVDSN